MDKPNLPQSSDSPQLSSRARINLFVCAFLQIMCMCYTLFTCLVLYWFDYCFWTFSLFRVANFMPFYGVKDVDNIWTDEIEISNSSDDAKVIEIYCEDIEDTMKYLIRGAKAMYLGQLICSLAYLINISLFINKFFNPKFKVNHIQYIIILPLVLQILSLASSAIIGRFYSLKEVNTWGQTGDLAPVDFRIAIGLYMYIVTLALEVMSAIYAVLAISKHFK